MPQNSKGLCNYFVNSLDDIYNKNKEEIVEFLDKIDDERLPLLRIKLYIKLVEKFPEWDLYELITRDTKSMLINDIYDVGYCIHHGPDETRLNKILTCAKNICEYSSNDKPESLTISYTKSKLCITKCRYKDSKSCGKADDMVQCHSCQHWYHPSCISENGKEIINIWSCPGCRSLPDVIYSMSQMMSKMQQESSYINSELVKKLTELEKQLSCQTKHIQELRNQVSENATELANAKGEIVSLRGVVADLSTKLTVQTWKGFQRQHENKSTLLIGSSVIRDVSASHLKDTEVTCIPGGTIKDVADKVRAIPSSKYDSIVVVVGGNDCNPRNPNSKQSPAAIVDQYKSLVKLCKDRTSSVVVSSICPRIGDTDVQNCIDSVNAGLQVMCVDEEVDFRDNSHIFYLKNDSINDGYFLDDGIHLTFKAVDKLSQNLGLTKKEGINSVCVRKQKRKHENPKRRDNFSSVSPASYSEQEVTYDGLSHQSWATAYKKAGSQKGYGNHRRHHTLANSYNHNNITHEQDIRCYNCFENNHTQKACRHERPILCNTCGREGHKSKHHQF